MLKPTFNNSTCKQTIQNIKVNTGQFVRNLIMMPTTGIQIHDTSKGVAMLDHRSLSKHSNTCAKPTAQSWFPSIRINTLSLFPWFRGRWKHLFYFIFYLFVLVPLHPLKTVTSVNDQLHIITCSLYTELWRFHPNLVYFQYEFTYPWHVHAQVLHIISWSSTNSYL